MSSYFLGIDVGSTSITSIIIDTKKRKVIESSTVNNLAEVTKLKDKKLGRSEWNMDKIFSGVVETIKTTIDKSKISPEAIGITGQQQGLQLFNKDNEGVGNFISWQDQRCKERFNSKTYIEIMAEMGGATISENQLPFFQNTGCPLVTGYTAPLLFWLKNNNEGLRPLFGPTQTLEADASDCCDTKCCDNRIPGGKTMGKYEFKCESSGKYNCARNVNSENVSGLLGNNTQCVPSSRCSCCPKFKSTN